MGIIEVFFISIGVAMDAFAVSICKGLSMKRTSIKKSLIIASYFGIFQAGMALIGFTLGKSFENFVTQIDHWIAFILLAFIGINMIKESLSKDEEGKNDDISFKTMIILAIATSIDSLAVGITFAFLEVKIIIAITIIGITTFLISYLGTIIGNKFGSRYEKKAETFGGIILILMGLKILIEHLFEL